MLGIAKGCDFKYQTLLLRLGAAYTVFTTLCSYRFDACYLASKMKRQRCPAETCYSMAYPSTRYYGREGLFQHQNMSIHKITKQLFCRQRIPVNCQHDLCSLLANVHHITTAERSLASCLCYYVKLCLPATTSNMA